MVQKVCGGNASWNGCGSSSCRRLLGAFSKRNLGRVGRCRFRWGRWNGRLGINNWRTTMWRASLSRRCPISTCGRCGSRIRVAGRCRIHRSCCWRWCWSRSRGGGRRPASGIAIHRTAWRSNGSGREFSRRGACGTNPAIVWRSGATAGTLTPRAGVVATACGGERSQVSVGTLAGETGGDQHQRFRSGARTRQTRLSANDVVRRLAMAIRVVPNLWSSFFCPSSCCQFRSELEGADRKMKDRKMCSSKAKRLEGTPPVPSPHRPQPHASQNRCRLGGPDSQFPDPRKKPRPNFGKPWSKSMNFSTRKPDSL